MKIYVASSWRNEFQQEVVTALRSDGHAVYDFKGPGDGWGGPGNGPGGFSWKEVDPDWMNWTSNIPSYLRGLQHPRAEEGFLRDMDALRAANVCVMVHPCGVSAAMETGWAVGAGKKVFVYVPGLREPDLMIKMADLVTDDLQQIRNKLEPPHRIEILDRVISEIPFGPRLVVEPGIYSESEIWLNEHGAVAIRAKLADRDMAIRADGGYLGVKPGEFRWVTE